MVRKALVCGLSLVFLIIGYSAVSFSSDAGPEEITLKSSTSDKKPPAIFPHLKHQEAFACGDCHHGMADGKQTPYSEDMQIKKCEECHNADVLGGKKSGKYDLDEFKDAAHANCLECHKDMAEKDSSMKKLRSCSTCHQK